MACPAGFAPCDGELGCYFSWEAVGQGSFFGCEYVGVALFCGIDDARDVRLRCTGYDDQNRLLFELERSVHRIARGQVVSLEIPRHEMPAVPHQLRVTVVAMKHPLPDDAKERSSTCRPWWSSSWEE